ncbi:MAG: PilZ domain-containing protein [Terriglobia bacterium]
MRTSDRVYLEVPITISGTDNTGQEFEENTQTLVVSRRGAKIISRHTLVPQQKLMLRSLMTGLDAELRVIGPILGDEEGCHFGVEILHPELNVWGIAFPLLDGTENPAGRAFLACANCHAQEVVHLDVFELEVLLANECLTRPCQQCNQPTLWARTAAAEERNPVDVAVSESRHTIQERRAPRISLKVNACLRDFVHGQEVVTTENISRGGFRFCGHKDYPIGTVMEAALPYSPGAANIFTPIRIVYKDAVIRGGTFVHGVAYVPSPRAPSLTGMRIDLPK